MSSEAVIDFSQVLAPIPGDKPTGVDLRADSSPTSPYYKIKDARSAARAAERQLAMGDEVGEPPNWRPVLQHGTKTLAELSKDLEVLAYMIEALARQHGFAGMRDGFRVARELIEQFWDDLYPLPDEEGMLTRVAPLTGLNGDDAEGTLINPITRVPLTEGSSVGPYAYYHYQQAGTVSQLADPEARERRIQAGAVSMEMFERAVAETPAMFFANLVEDITACQDEYSRLGLILDEKCGAAAPPTSNIRAALNSCLDSVKGMARDKLASVAPIPEEEAAAGEAAGTGDASGEGNGQAIAVGAIRTREDALRNLAKVADFFRKNEPHTPVSYAVEQAVRWARMPLPELMMELIPEMNARDHLFKMVGIRPPDQSSS